MAPCIAHSPFYECSTLSVCDAKILFETLVRTAFVHTFPAYLRTPALCIVGQYTSAVQRWDSLVSESPGTHICVRSQDSFVSSRLLSRNPRPPLLYSRLSFATQLALMLDIGFSITPEWVAKLRQDVKKWDDRVRLGRKNNRPRMRQRWVWPELAPPPLKYTGDAAERVSISQS